MSAQSIATSGGAIRVSNVRHACCSLRSTAWFTEGFDTLDLKEAKKLLEELSS